MFAVNSAVQVGNDGSETNFVDWFEFRAKICVPAECVRNRLGSHQAAWASMRPGSIWRNRGSFPVAHAQRYSPAWVGIL